MSRIKKMREMLGWTQRTLSRKSGVERTKISLAECGYVKLSADEQSAIEQVLCSALRVHVEQAQSLAGGSAA